MKNENIISSEKLAVKIKNLNVSYGEKAVFKDFNLEIKKNEITVILGESGGGKTTLLNCIAGLTDHSGEIEKNFDKVSYVFQKDRLIPNLTVEENINLVAKDCNVSSRLEKVGLKGYEKAYPKQLSAGMARRVAICRALCYNGDLLLMDEPFINIDVAKKVDIINRLKNFYEKNGGSVIMVTHDIKEACLFADRIIVLKNKKIVYDTSVVNDQTEKILFDVLIG